MADGSIRAEIAFNENVKLSHFEDLINTIVTVLIAPQGDMEKISDDIADHLNPN